jgi:hypothetical protein
MYIVGVDPGLAGAVAVLDAHGTLEALADTPTLTLKVQRGTRQGRMMSLVWLRSYGPTEACTRMSRSKRHNRCQDRVPARCLPLATATGSG